MGRKTIKTLEIILVVVLFAHVANAENPQETVTKIVIHVTAPEMQPDSFAAKPKTVWRMGRKCGRIQEEPDKATGMHGLMICNEPHAWMINLQDKSGRHIVDRDPAGEFHVPIVISGNPPQPVKPLESFELGEEFKYLKAKGVKATGSASVAGQNCDRYEVEVADFRVILFSAAGTEVPRRVEVFKDGKRFEEIHYDAYETKIPPDMSLFEPPKGISIVEVR